MKSTTDHKPRQYCIDWKSAGPLEAGLRELQMDLGAHFDESGFRISFASQDGLQGFARSNGKDGIEIQYGRPGDAFRGLASVLADAGEGGLKETSPFTSLGVMIDLSRNAVLKVEGLKRHFRQFALMGINTVHLYMEDVYQIEGEPFFGYCRGVYTPAELKEIDDYGDALGIEVIPCIQTLGHLEQILQWPAYADLIDVRGVLLVGEEKTYALIARMLDTLVSCFRTRRFHIGMDEAHGVGQGQYRKLNGDNRPFDVLNLHLKKVMDLCRERGIHPMIWSDMYFRIGSKNNDYYDRDTVIPADVVEQIPAEVELVYWDYYHTDAEFYTDWIARHRALGKEPIFAAGAWTWGRFWTHFPHAFATIRPGMAAARQDRIREAILTIWGDDGNECDPFSALPTVQFFADCAYGASLGTAELSRRFAITCGGDWETVMLGSEVDAIPGIGPVAERSANPGKWILWHDPLTNFLGKHIPEELAGHYENLAARLKERVEAGQTSVHSRFIAQLADALAKKTQIHLQVGGMYRQGDIKGLRQLFATTLPDAIGSIETLLRLHREIWFDWRKPFGWEGIEYRYAGVLSRLRTLQDRLREYLAGQEAEIPELAFEPEKIRETGEIGNVYFGYARVRSPDGSRW